MKLALLVTALFFSVCACADYNPEGNFSAIKQPKEAYYVWAGGTAVGGWLFPAKVYVAQNGIVMTINY